MQKRKTLQFRDKKLLFSCDHHFEKTLKKTKKNSRERDQVTYHSKTNKIECIDTIQPEIRYNLYKCVSVLWDPLIGML